MGVRIVEAMGETGNERDEKINTVLVCVMIDRWVGGIPGGDGVE
jgi:hypothetical protein